MPAYNKICQDCGQPFTAKRRDAAYCSNTCTQRFRRKSLKRLQYAPSAAAILENAAMLGKLKTILPRTAESIAAFIAENEALQTGVLVRLALTAHVETTQVGQHEE